MDPTTQTASTEDFEALFQHLRSRSAELARTSAAERIEKLRRLYQAVYDLRAEIGEAGLKETGLNGQFALVPLKIDVDFACSNLGHWMQPTVADENPTLQGRKGYILWEPKGVVLHLSTWNSPALICLSPLVSMIAAGNAVVLKPSEIAPHSGQAVARVIERAGLTGDVAVVCGGPAAAQALLRLPFNHICYVGNNRVGRLVMEAAAQHFAGVTLEMGGKNPAIVECDADIDDAAAKITWGRQMIAGQVCLAPDYVLVHESIKDKFIETLKQKANAFYNAAGSGFINSPDMPRIINERHTVRIKNLIDNALAKGAMLVFGGDVDIQARFVSPTILDNVTPEMEIYDEEVFGPVLTIQGFTNREQVLAEIGRRPKPLGLYIFTTSRETADWYLANTRAGTSAINNTLVQANNPTVPFGGANHSGLGWLNGRFGFQEFSNGRGVVEDPLDPSQGPPMYYPPMAEGALFFVEQMLAPSPAAKRGK